MRKSKIDIAIDWNVLKTHEKKHISDYITQKAEGYNLHEYRLIFDGNPKIHVLYHADRPNPPEGYKKAFIPVCELQKEETGKNHWHISRPLRQHYTGRKTEYTE